MRKRKRSVLLAFAFIAPLLAACEPNQDTSGIAMRTAAEECRRQIEVGLLPELIRSCDGLDVFVTGGTLNNDFPLAVQQYADKNNEDKTSTKTVAGATTPTQHTSTTNPVLVWIYGAGSSSPITHTPSQPAYTRSAVSSTYRQYGRPSFAGSRPSYSGPVSSTPSTAARSGFGSTASSTSSSTGG